MQEHHEKISLNTNNGLARYWQIYDNAFKTAYDARKNWKSILCAATDLLTNLLKMPKATDYLGRWHNSNCSSGVPYVEEGMQTWARGNEGVLLLVY